MGPIRDPIMGMPNDAGVPDLEAEKPPRSKAGQPQTSAARMGRRNERQWTFRRMFIRRGTLFCGGALLASGVIFQSGKKGLDISPESGIMSLVPNMEA